MLVNLFNLNHKHRIVFYL